MKLIVQIPALNEEKTLATAIAAIPRDIPEIANVEILVIDDGSTDDTVAVLRRAGADRVLQMSSNVGLARAFSAGIEEVVARLCIMPLSIKRLKAIIRAGRKCIPMASATVRAGEAMQPMRVTA